MALKRIFGIGGKFLVEPWEEPLLQKHLLNLSSKTRPDICYIGAAVGDDPFEFELFARQMNMHDCRVRHLNMFAPQTADFADYLCTHDIVYVNGGATRNLIALAREWSLDKALLTAWEAGVLMSGTSAGAICWFEGCITDSLPKRLLPQECFGFLRGSCSTHYDARPDRPLRFAECIRNDEIPSPGLALDDHTAAYFENDTLKEVVSARDGAGARWIEKKQGEIVETRIATRALS